MNKENTPGFVSNYLWSPQQKKAFFAKLKKFPGFFWLEKSDKTFKETTTMDFLWTFKRPDYKGEINEVYTHWASVYMGYDGELQVYHGKFTRGGNFVMSNRGMDDAPRDIWSQVNRRVEEFKAHAVQSFLDAKEV
jgi:hypothetical protein